MTLDRFHKRVEEKLRDYRNSGAIVIVAFGDSVTMGATGPKRLEPEAVYHNRVKRMLEDRYATVFSVINSGIGGETAAMGLKRIGRDVLRYQPDLVFIGFGLNDASDEPEKLSAFKSQMQQMVQQVQGVCDVVLLTPSFMAGRPNPHVDPAFAHVLDRFIELQTKGHVGRFAEAIREVGSAENVAVADVYARWEALERQGFDTTELLANGLNHPTGEAHQIAADAIMDVITRKQPE